MRRVVVILVLFFMFCVAPFVYSGSNPTDPLVGKKECIQGALESGDKLLRTCVDDSSQTPESGVIVKEVPYKTFSSNVVTVLPEIATVVDMSNTDVNRVICPDKSGEVNVVYSTEKGLIAKVVENNVFIKFNVLKKKEGIQEETFYKTTPSEMYIICGGEVFSLIVMPKNIPTQVIKLSTGERERIKQNVKAFAGMPFEDRVLDLIISAYKDSIPSGYTVERRMTDVPLYENMRIVMQRVVSVDGTGLRLIEYQVKSLKDNIRVDESTFLRPEISGRIPVAIALEDHVLTPLRPVRLFVVEMVKEEVLNER